MKQTRKRKQSKMDAPTITDLAQWIHSCKHEKPAEAKNQKSLLFDVLMTDPIYRKIFSENHDLEDLVSICRIAFFVKRKLRSIPVSKRVFEKEADFHFMAALYRLRDKNWNLNWKYVRVNKIIRETVKDLRADQGQDLTYHKIFTKMGATWQIIREKVNML